MWKLVIEDDEGKRTVVPLTRNEYTIGRKEGNTIRLTERNVSRDHAKITRRPGATPQEPIFTLGDLNSYNGVYVNGLRVAESQDLAHGDLVQIGDYRIVLQDEAVDATDATDAAVPESQDLRDTISKRKPPPPPPLRATNATFLEKPNRLVVLAGPNPGEEFPLVGERLTIGRAEDCTVSVNHNSVSRLHCEVHALGEARFEIVDKGSSNGVRVNGADLRRGIIEAGDIIELGDVKFKFVGEGQLFRPGTTDSQQLAAIGHRAATSVIKTKSSHGVVLPAVVVAVLLAIAVGAAIVLRSPPPRGESPVPTASASSGAPDTTGIDAAMLAEARRMCDVGEVEAAHQKASQLVAESPLHTSDDFKYVEAKWSELALMQADSERDPATKYAIYQRLTSDPFLDPTVKKFALAHMNAIDTTPQRDASKTAVAAAPQAVRTAEPAVPTAAPVRPTPQAAPEAPAPRPAPRPAPASLSLSDLATSSNPADWQKARDQLEPKVFGKRGATADDVRMLKAICKAQHDQTCLTELSHM